MGGDLPFCFECIKTNKKKKLKRYAHLCIDAIYSIYTVFSLPVITIALVDGNAFGGGFECALAHDYIIASEDVKFGLPENKFNLFLGMGAYSLLNRKLSPVDANDIIRSGKVNKSRYFESLGIVERVVEMGEELKALDDFIKN